MPDLPRGDRPLSPFMIGPYYRPQWTSMSSIANRIAGVGLTFACLLTVWWFAALARGEGAYDVANGLITSFLGDLVMFFSMAALWYHLLAGIRHLIWDSGRMLDVERSERFAQMSVIVTALLAIFTVIVV